jgi:hypothetical protein
LWLTALLLAVADAAAQTPDWPIDPDTAPRPVTEASRASGPIEVNGRLDEGAWKAAEPITEFIQTIPDAG